MCGTPVSRTLLVSLEAKRVHDKTVIMTYLNEHTHTHIQIWRIGKPQRCLREASGTSEERHKMDPSSSN